MKNEGEHPPPADLSSSKELRFPGLISSEHLYLETVKSKSSMKALIVVARRKSGQTVRSQVTDLSSCRYVSSVRFT